MKVYGVFKNGERAFTIWTGKITNENQSMVTVDYGAFSWTYRSAERGRTFFDTLEEAGKWAEELRTMMKYQEG